MAIDKVEKIRRFKNVPVLPTVYDDALSYMELIDKCIQTCNKVIDALNEQDDEIEAFEARVEGQITEFEEGIESYIEEKITEMGADQTEFKERITAGQTAFEGTMQAQYDEFLENYERQFGVVQTTGQSTTDVPSQKAVTDLVNETKEEIEEKIPTSPIDMEDVEIQGELKNGQTVVWNEYLQKWINSTTAGELSQLADVRLNELADGDTIYWSTTYQKWINLPSAGSLRGLVDTAIANQQNGEALMWDNATGKWANKTVGREGYNFIDNGQFRINQRGQTSYSGLGNYCVDRWVMRGCSVSINGDKSIRITNASGTRSPLRQIINVNELPNGKLCFSVISGGKLFQQSFTKYSTGTINVTIDITDIDGDTIGTASLTQTTSEVYIEIAPNNLEDDYVDVTEIKLEVGEYSTAGGTVAYFDDKYYLELLRCLSSTKDSDDTYANKGLSTNGMGATVKSFKNIYAGTAEMEDGVTPLESGTIYLQYSDED